MDFVFHWIRLIGFSDPPTPNPEAPPLPSPQTAQLPVLEFAGTLGDRLHGSESGHELAIRAGLCVGYDRQSVPGSASSRTMSSNRPNGSQMRGKRPVSPRTARRLTEN